MTMMTLKSRYHILPDSRAGAMVLDTETGAVQYPTCWQDLSAFYHYLVGRGRVDESQTLLAEAMAGNMPITRMLSFMSRGGNVPSRA
jgi:hypothetical protein